MYGDVLSSDFFVRHLLDSDWRIIPMLLKCNKNMRSRVQKYLPDHLRIMFHEARDYPRLSHDHQMRYQIIRKSITGLFMSGTLQYFLDYLGSDREHNRFDTLTAIPPELARDWPRCQDLLICISSAPIFYRGNWLPQLCKLTQPGYDPLKIFNGVIRLQQTARTQNSRELKTPKIDIKTSIDLTEDGNHRARYQIWNPATRCFDVCFSDDPPELILGSLPGDNRMHTYFLVLLYGNRPELVRHFYSVFAPTITGAASLPGAWDLLVFCSLFDLDLSIMLSGFGHPRGPENK